jgi:hypothetical protein
MYDHLCHAKGQQTAKGKEEDHNNNILENTNNSIL